METFKNTSDEQTQTLERIKAQFQLASIAISNKENAVITTTAIAAALLIVGTFNENLFPLTNFVKILVTILLFIIPTSLFTYLLSSDRTVNKALKNIEVIMGKELPKKNIGLDYYFSYYPYIIATVITLVVLCIMYLMWCK